jgi:hypothetical protein
MTTDRDFPFRSRISGSHAASTKMAVFWDVVSYSLVEVNRCFRCACCDEQPRQESVSDVRTGTLFPTGPAKVLPWPIPRPRLTHRSDDGGSKHLGNVEKLPPDYTALQPRRQPSSFSFPLSVTLLCPLGCENKIAEMQILLSCNQSSTSDTNTKMFSLPITSELDNSAVLY